MVVEREPWSNKFARYRRAKGWSLADAARAFIAVSDLHTSDQIDSVRRTISRWEQGGIEVPCVACHRDGTT